MVAKPVLSGLIAATRTNVTPALDDLVTCCEWPLVLEASPRRLRRELSLCDPECVLFWLDDGLEVAATARLISWSQQRGARPFRVAVARRLDGDIESVLRAAGAHSVLLVAGQTRRFIADILWPLVHDVSRGGRGLPQSTPLIAAADRGLSVHPPPVLVRPP